MTERLTSLATVKEWLDITTADSDTQLLRLIDAASRFVLNWLNRDTFRVRQFTQNFRGNGQQSQLLANWPVIAVSSLGIAGTSVGASTLGNVGMPGSGFTISDQRNGYQSIELYGYSFGRGAPSQVVYTAGFTTTDTSVVPVAVEGKVTYLPTEGGQWSLDKGVTLNGIAATKVTADPTVGQYSVDEWGVYTFASADIGKALVISYDYVPADVTQAVTEIIGEWYKRKDRIGILSKTLGGQETVTFSQGDMNKSVRDSLQSYKNII